MIEKEKALVFGETKGFIKSFDQPKTKPFPFKNQDVCSFCGGELMDDSIRFKGISACANCLQMFSILDTNLRDYQTKRNGKI